MKNNVKMEIKAFHSSDIEDLEAWQPDRPEKVSFGLSLYIGETGKSTSDIYQVLVATPEGLRESTARRGNGVISERAALVVERFEWRIVRATLEAIVDRCSGQALVECQWKLQRYFQWEYEDYTEGIRVVS